MLRPDDISNRRRIVANSRGKKRRPGSKDIASAIRCNDASFVSFLEGCLMWDRRVRLNPEQALQHDWITEAAIPSSNQVRRWENQPCARCTVLKHAPPASERFQRTFFSQYSPAFFSAVRRTKALNPQSQTPSTREVHSRMKRSVVPVVRQRREGRAACRAARVQGEGQR